MKHTQDLIVLIFSFGVLLLSLWDDGHEWGLHGSS